MYQISVFTLYYMQTKTEKNVMSGLLNCCFMTGFKSIKLFTGTDNDMPDVPKLKVSKVHIFWEGHKILWYLHQSFVICTASQIIGGDFAKFCGLLRIYELYLPIPKIRWKTERNMYNFPIMLAAQLLFGEWWLVLTVTSFYSRDLS